MSSGCADARYERVLNEVNREIVRAKNLHGPVDFNSPHEGFAVLDEERDELWDLVKLNPKRISVHLGAKALVLDAGAFEAEMGRRRREAHRSMMREEAIQLAAMAVRFAAELT